MFQTKSETYSKWWKKGPKRGQLAHVMCMLWALVRPLAAEPISVRGFSFKKRSDLQRQCNREPAGSTRLDPMPPGMLKKEKKEPERETGPGIMRGSNTPWAQGPANLCA